MWLQRGECPCYSCCCAGLISNGKHYPACGLSCRRDRPQKDRPVPAATPVTLNAFVIHISLPALAILHIHTMKIDSSLLLTAAMGLAGLRRCLGHLWCGGQTF